MSTSKPNRQFLTFQYIEDEDDLKDFEDVQFNEIRVKLETVAYVNLNNVSSFSFSRYVDDIELERKWYAFELLFVSDEEYSCIDGYITEEQCIKMESMLGERIDSDASM